MTIEISPSLPPQAFFAGPPPGKDDRERNADAGAGGEPAAELEQPAELHLSRIRVPGPDRLAPPEVDHRLIRDCLHLEDCEARVAEHHRYLFRSWHASDTEQAVQNRDLIHRYIQRLEERIRVLSRQLQRTDELIRQEQEAKGTTAWSTLDLVAVTGFGLFSLVLLGMGMNTLATYLMDSGFIIFVERPALAYLLSAVNLGLAVLLKVGSSWLRNDAAKHRYFLWLWGLGLFSGALWLITFAVIFPNIEAQGVDEVIASLGQESSLKHAVLDGIFVCSQLVSEICISAALWMHLERIARAHAPGVVMARNPEHRGYLKRLSGYNERLRASVDKRAALEGWLEALRACETAYLSRATAAAKAGQALRQAESYGLAGRTGAVGRRDNHHREDS